MSRVAVVTGGSSGIGAATVARLAADGFDVVAGARRLDRLHQVCEPVGARALPLDVTDTRSVAAFCEAVGSCDVLINNAGGALGLDPVASGDDDQWRTMFETNVLGVMRMTRSLLPAIEASGDGHVVLIGSIAGIETYEGGGGYAAAKHAAHAVGDTLRLELLGRPVRVTTIAPGMVETDFSLVRFDGDTERASAVYRGVTPLSADDVADCIAWAVTRPSHVDVDLLVVRPRDQARAHRVARREAGP